MRCAEFRVRLDGVLDARRAPQRDPELKAHARHCPKCAQWMAGHDELIATIAELPTISPAPDFGLQVLQEFAQVQRQRIRRQHLAHWSMALAGGLLLALISWQNLNLYHADSIPKIGSHPALGTVAFESHYLQLAETTRNLAGNITSPQVELVGEVAEGFKPVTRSVYSALHNLWRTLPGSDVAQAML
jgi:predicted anti-sigma-YlaC factor YlaD